MKLLILEEPQLAFCQNSVHVDIRAGLSAFGVFDKGSAGVPVPIRLGVIGLRPQWMGCVTGWSSARTGLVQTRRS
jgi:hypothetical protein